MRYSLIVFDWDGTLIDSAGAIAECIQQAARDMDLPVPDRDTASHVIGLGLHDSLRHAVPALPREKYGEFVERYRQHFLAREDSMAPFAGVRELLVRLNERGHWLAIATGKSRSGLERALQASGLGAHFLTSRCADETSPKPHPAMLLELMREIDVAPASALMVGDTSHDLAMAGSAGVDAVAVSYGAHPADTLRALQPRACLETVAELTAWLVRNA